MYINWKIMPNINSSRNDGRDGLDSVLQIKQIMKFALDDTKTYVKECLRLKS